MSPYRVVFQIATLLLRAAAAASSSFFYFKNEKHTKGPQEINESRTFAGVYCSFCEKKKKIKLDRRQAKWH